MRQRRGRFSVVAAAAVAASVLIGALTAPAAYASADGPTLVLSKSTAKLGEYIGVTGSGFPIGTQLQVEICGIGGSSNSCAIAAAVGATADALGGFHQMLRIVEPPTPCPCTVHVTPFAGTAADPVDTPISIPGLRYLPQADPAADAGTAKLMQATAADDSPFLMQLGADGSVRVTVTFANLSGGPAPDPGVVLTVSRSGKQVGRYPLAWTGGALPVGARRTLTADLALPGGWFHDYEIGVALGPAAHQATVRTLSAAVRPWGELAAPAALAVGVGCLLAARRRRYEPVRGLRVRRGAVAGPRSGAGVPGAFPGPFSGPFSGVEAATLGIVVAAPGLENATAETAETSGNGGS
jgi:hypothetical protein